MNGNTPATAQVSLPLYGKRIVITRARSQAASLVRAVEDLGGHAIEFPTIEIQPMADPGPLDTAIKSLDRYDWLIFTSANGVEVFFDRVTRLDRSREPLRAMQCAAIGPETAKRLELAGIKKCVIPVTYKAEGILDLLRPESMKGQRVLIPRAAQAREVLPETLRQWGAEVDVVETYRAVIPKTDASALGEKLRQREIDMVTFTSSSTVRNFAALFGGQGLAAILNQTPIACIGPITEETVKQLGGSAAVSGREFTIGGLISAIVEYFRGCAPGP